MPGRIEKTVFISYRRTNVPWALAIYQNLTTHGYDVFFDYQSIDSGNFENVILENIKTRAHFLIILTPSALERCKEPGDWLRREIETAIEEKRNIVPLMMESFDFGSPLVKEILTGKLAALSQINGLKIYSEYFFEAMDKLRERYLNVTLSDIVLPTLNFDVKKITESQQIFANEADRVEREELTAQEWFERGYIFAIESRNLIEAIRCFSEAIHLQPKFAEAYGNRGAAYYESGDLDSAIVDLGEAIRLQPGLADAYNNRGNAHSDKGDLGSAINDYNEAIRLKPNEPDFYFNRGITQKESNNLDAAIRDFNKTIRLNPDFAGAFFIRGNAKRDSGNMVEAIKDYSKAIKLQPDDMDAYYNRATILEMKNDYASAIADFQKFLELGGGKRDRNHKEIDERIKELSVKLTKKKSMKKKSK